MSSPVSNKLGTISPKGGPTGGATKTGATPGSANGSRATGPASGQSASTTRGPDPRAGGGSGQKPKKNDPHLAYGQEVVSTPTSASGGLLIGKLFAGAAGEISAGLNGARQWLTDRATGVVNHFEATKGPDHRTESPPGTGPPGYRAPEFIVNANGTSVPTDQPNAGDEGGSGKLVHTGPKGQKVYSFDLSKPLGGGPFGKLLQRMNPDGKPIPATAYVSALPSGASGNSDGHGLVLHYPDHEYLSSLVAQGGGGSSVVEAVVKESERLKRSVQLDPVNGTVKYYQDRGFRMLPNGRMIHEPGAPNEDRVRLKLPLAKVGNLEAQGSQAVLRDADVLKFAAGLPVSSDGAQLKLELTKFLRKKLGDNLVARVFPSKAYPYRNWSGTLAQFLETFLSFPDA